MKAQMAVLWPVPSHPANRTSRPKAGIAWPPLANASTGGARRWKRGRVTRIPSGMAITTTKAVDHRVMLMCSRMLPLRLDHSSIRAVVGSKSL